EDGIRDFHVTGVQTCALPISALELVRDPGSFLSTVQIGITLVGIIAGAYSGATLATQLGVWLNTFPLLAPNGDAIAIGLVVMMRSEERRVGRECGYEGWP